MLFYKWRKENASNHDVEPLMKELQNTYRAEMRNNTIKVDFYTPQEYTRYYFSGKFKEIDNYIELKGVFYTSRFINYIVFCLSLCFMALLVVSFPPISLVNILCNILFVLFFIILNLIFYIITISCHNWSLYFWKDREEFLKFVDRYMKRK